MWRPVFWAAMMLIALGGLYVGVSVFLPSALKTGDGAVWSAVTLSVAWPLAVLLASVAEYVDRPRAQRRPG